MDCSSARLRATRANTPPQFCSGLLAESMQKTRDRKRDALCGGPDACLITKPDPSWDIQVLLALPFNRELESILPGRKQPRMNP